MTLSRTAYDADLADAEWESLVTLAPPGKAGGRPPKHSRREILNGIFYAVRGGGAWRLLLRDLPPWRTVYPISDSGTAPESGNKSMAGCGNRYEGNGSPPVSECRDSE